MTLSFLVPKTPEEKGEIDARSVYVGNVSLFFFFKETIVVLETLPHTSCTIALSFPCSL